MNNVLNYIFGSLSNQRQINIDLIKSINLNRKSLAALCVSHILLALYVKAAGTQQEKLEARVKELERKSEETGD